MGMVTREAVFNAAQLVMTRGDRPSQANIRRELGGGSFSDIGPMLREWQAAQRSVGIAPALEMPEAAKTAISEMGTKVWGVLSAEFAAAVEAVRRDFASARQELALELAEEKEAVSLLEAEIADLGRELAKAREDVEGFAPQLRALSEARVQADARAEAMQATIARLEAEVVSHLGRREQQEMELATLRQENVGLREARAGTEAMWSATEARNLELEDRQQQMDERVTRAEARSDVAETRADRLREELEGRDAALSALRDQYAAMSGRHREELATGAEKLRKTEDAARFWKTKAEGNTVSRSAPPSPQGNASSQVGKTQ